MSNLPPPNPFALNTSSQSVPPPPLNPYEVSAVQPSRVSGTDPESIRKYYISHEASVKSIGTLYLLGALLCGLGTVLYVGMFINGLVSSDPEAQMLVVPMAVASVVAGTAAALQAVCCYGLWALKGWARVTATVLACIGLLMFPLGTLINAYFLYLLHSEKASTVFSDGYKEIIRQTPHVKYRTSILAWVALGIIILVVVGIITLAVFAGTQ